MSSNGKFRRPANLPSQVGRRVSFQWVDSAGHTEWRSVSDATAQDNLLCDTTGYCIRDTESYIEVASTVADGQQLRDTIAVPWRCVEKFKGSNPPWRLSMNIRKEFRNG